MEIMPMGPEPMPSDETDLLVAEILRALPERYSRVLELRFLRGYSVSETAQELDVTPENAKVLQHRALARADRIFMVEQLSGRQSTTAMDDER
jgi:RNA polymerase sigma-70 factor (ECF subfamily)